MFDLCVSIYMDGLLPERRSSLSKHLPGEGVGTLVNDSLVGLLTRFPAALPPSG